MDTNVIEKTENKQRTCPMYKVIMHNDDVTHMDFVVGVLISIFGNEMQRAVEVMLEIHNNGHGLAGVFALEHAELKVDQCHSLARSRNFPLLCTIEPA